MQPLVTTALVMDLDEWEKSITAIERKQLPYAASVALTTTAIGARDHVRRTMRWVFDKPTKFALNGIVYDTATKKDLTSRVIIAGSTWNATGLPATAFLGPQVFGGMRKHKSFEKQLINRGMMKKNEVAVPADGLNARLNKYGNVTQGMINQMMADIQIEYRGAGATRVRTARSLKNNQNYKKARFFVPQRGGHLFPGIYSRTPKTNKVKPLMLFVTQRAYQVRLDFENIVSRYAVRELPQNFAVAFAKALSTAK